MSNYIIVTSPHTKCEDHPYRNCDTRARDAAYFLYHKLSEIITEKKYNIKVVYYPNDEIPRGLCDLNRPSCRHTSYREKLDSIIDNIEKSGDKVSWVLDMHSFPYYNSWYSSYNQNDYNLVFLYLSKSPFHENRIFRENLNRPDVGFLEGSLYNDIVLTSIERGIKSILIESLENKELFSDQEMKNILTQIANITINNL